MNDGWITECIMRAIPLLSKWRGGRTKVWEFDPTHSKITLRIEFRGVPGNLHIICGGCRHINGPFAWKDCGLEIQAHVDGETMALVDTHAGFELVFELLSLRENVEPVYHPSLGSVE